MSESEANNIKLCELNYFKIFMKKKYKFYISNIDIYMQTDSSLIKKINGNF